MPRSAHEEADGGLGQALEIGDSGGRGTKMPEEEWIKTLSGGRTVKFVYQELPLDGAFITAQIAGHEVVYSVVLTKAGNPLSHEDVESHFKAELST
jgi:hypothetical protein